MRSGARRIIKPVMSDRATPSAHHLAAYASDAGASQGRLYPEHPSANRSPFQRDRDRIIHCGAFRRLAQKTQVFLPEASDQYRTRLTHTIEVAQIARTIARALGLDDDLTEALALAHDLGHPPFGHTGEEALDQVLASAGGFDHNAQTLRIVSRLERRYPAFPGLNLTWETLEGLVKRGGPPALRPADRPQRRCAAAIVGDLDTALSLDLGLFPSGEAQAAAIADDIAYNAHDLEDGLDAGLFGLPDLRRVEILNHVLDLATAETSGDPDLIIRALTRTMVGLFVDDVIAESRQRLAAIAPADVGGVRRLGRAAVSLSPALAEASRDVKLFLSTQMYRHPNLTRVREQASCVVTELTTHLLSHPDTLPSDPGATGAPDGPRRVADYVAGLTDRGALAEHRRFFRTTPDLR